MIEICFEPFIGLHLQIYENQLRDCGVILDCTKNREGIMHFVTETGEYWFYYVHPNPSPLMQLRQLLDGNWMLWGDGPRWAYVKEL